VSAEEEMHRRRNGAGGKERKTLHERRRRALGTEHKSVHRLEAEEKSRVSGL